MSQHLYLHRDEIIQGIEALLIAEEPEAGDIKAIAQHFADKPPVTGIDPAAEIPRDELLWLLAQRLQKISVRCQEICKVQYLKSVPQRYFKSIPKELPPGEVLVHNLRPDRIFDMTGFRGWTEPLHENLEPCSCSWAGHNKDGKLTHYRVKLVQITFED